MANLVQPVLTAALYFLCILVTASSEELLTTLTGRNVPVRIIQEHFSNRFIFPDNDADLLYELTDDQILFGPSLHIDLRTEARLLDIRTSPFSSTLDLNGERTEPVPTKIKILRARDYDFILDKNTDQLLSVSGNGIALVPLHQADLTGIFVNKRAFSKRDKLMADDIVVPPDEPIARGFNGTGMEEIIATHQSGGSCASGATHYIELAVAYDNTFCALYGNNEAVATAALQSLFDKANVPYAQKTCVQLALVHVEAHCKDPNDPFRSFPNNNCVRTRSCSPSALILDGFMRYWREKRSNVRADAAYIITGFDEGTSVAGRAAIAAACNSRFGFGWVEGPDAKVLAHEVGHTLSGGHTASGIMKGIASPRDPMVFSDESVRQFTQFLDRDPRSSCVETSKPRCDASCPVPCVNNKCVKSRSPPAGLVACTPVEGFYKCTFTREFRGSKFYFAEDCPEQFKYVQRKFDPNDLSLFCCTSPSRTTRKETVPFGTRTSTLNVNQPNGRVERFPTHIRDTSNLATVTLIQSKLVPSCNLGRGGSKPPASDPGGTSPPSSAIPPSRTRPPRPTRTRPPSPTRTRPPRPTREPTPPEPPSPGDSPRPRQRGTCESGFTRTRSLSCLTRDVGKMEVSRFGFRMGSVKVSVQQTNGEFRMRYGTTGRTYIAEYRELATTDDEAASAFVNSSSRRGVVVTRRGTPVVRTEWDALAMSKPGRTCCGKPLYVAVGMRLCRRFGVMNMCGTASQKFNVRIRCKNFCKGKPANAVLKPMSSSQACSSCE